KRINAVRREEMVASEEVDIFLEVQIKDVLDSNIGTDTFLLYSVLRQSRKKETKKEILSKNYIRTTSTDLKFHCSVSSRRTINLANYPRRAFVNYRFPYSSRIHKRRLPMSFLRRGFNKHSLVAANLRTKINTLPHLFTQRVNRWPAPVCQGRQRHCNPINH
ncbi:hypothetical protein CEXT_480901, partial [Caerostris extrusa]